MININSKKDCCGCNACYSICPTSCIKMIEDEEGFLYPNVDGSKCIGCEKCINVCPMINGRKYNLEIDVYAAQNNDKDIQFESSSGGIFSIIADYILDNNGVVYGAAYNEKFQIVHKGIYTKDDLWKLRGSKYVQSNINDTYREAKQNLKNNRLVLFSGTPCQIAGLINYLGKEYINLYLIDIVCHGVPSPGVFRRYINYMKDKFRANITNINFRAKELDIAALKIEFANGKKYLSLSNKDLFYRAFFSDIILRPSCYECRHNSFRSGSDITLADYWGASTRFPDYKEREDGVSLVINKTKKGKELFYLNSHKMEYIKSDIEHAAIKNPNIYNSSIMNSKRPDFFSEYQNQLLPIDKLLYKYTHISIFKRIIRKIKYIMDK